MTSQRCQPRTTPASNPPLGFRRLLAGAWFLALGSGLFAGCSGTAEPTETAQDVVPAAAVTRASPELRSRLQADLEFLAADALGGRAVGSPGNAQARQYLIERLEALGAEPYFSTIGQQFSTIANSRHRSDQSEKGVNLVVRVPGTGPEATRGLLAITAHYDHLPTRDGEVFNGADDNASGVAAVLEVVRRALERPLHNDLIAAFLDAEEVGLQGAYALVQRLGDDLDRVQLNVNLDMVGRSDHGEIYVAGTHHYPDLRPPLEEIAQRSIVKLAFGHDSGDGRDDWTNLSDHAAFHAAKVPFLYFGVEDHADYHRPTDDTDKIDFDFLAGVVDAVWDSLRALEQR